MPTLGYWPVRGLGQTIRLLLHYCEEDYEEIRYDMTPAGAGTKLDWFKNKYDIGLDFPNLPYYRDEHVQLTQSGTVLRYVAEKYNLAGTTTTERGQASMIADEFHSLREELGRIVYDKAVPLEDAKPGHLKKALEKLTQMQTFLADNDWIVGNKFTYADVALYELVCVHHRFAPEIFETLPKLLLHKQRLENVPAIKKYQSSPEYIHNLFHPPFAAWSGED